MIKIIQPWQMVLDLIENLRRHTTNQLIIKNKKISTHNTLTIPVHYSY